MLDVDVTITACLRPEILGTALHSFTENLLGKWNCRCIINIDPVGWSDFSTTLDVVGDYFSQVVVNESKEGHFGKAFKWCWSKVEAEWVFHLEDDWRLDQKVSAMDLQRILEVYPDLALLRLPQFKCGPKDMKNWNKFFPWNGQYYECPEDLRLEVGFCGHPSLIKGDFVRATVKHLDETKNPEKQFHAKSGPLSEEVLKWKYGVFGRPGQGSFITDLGRKWMVKEGYRKKGSKAFFLTWDKVE